MVVIDAKGDVNDIIIVASDTAFLPPSFPVKGYAGHTGRMDVVVRALISCLGSDFSFYGLLCGREPRPGRCSALVVDDCSRVSRMFDEREILVEGIIGKRLEWMRIVDVDVEHLVWKLSKRRGIFVVMDEAGEWVCDRRIRRLLEEKRPRIFFLGGHKGFPDSLVRVLSRYRPLKAALGPVSLHTSTVILVLRYLFDVGLTGFCERFEAEIES